MHIILLETVNKIGKAGEVVSVKDGFAKNFLIPQKKKFGKVHERLYSNLEWNFVGPYRGGRSTTAAGLDSKPYTFFMGTTGGGVWKTNDAGNTWNNVSDGQITAGSIGAIAISPSDENIIYVGTGSADPRGNISSGNGMYKSTDFGENWEFIGLPKAGLIGKISIHPKNSDIVYYGIIEKINYYKNIINIRINMYMR